MPLSDYYPEMKGWKPVTEPSVPQAPPIPDANNQISPYLRTTMPLSMQYQQDTMRQFNRPGTSSFRSAPLPPNALPTINSASAGIAEVTAKRFIVSGNGLPDSLGQAVISTASLANNANGVGTATLAPVFSLVFISVNVAARVRLYSTAAARDADVSRPVSVPPTPGLANYVISDHFLTGATGVPLKFPCSPPILGANQDTSPSATIYWSITNYSGSTQSISATLQFLQMEAT